MRQWRQMRQVRQHFFVLCFEEVAVPKKRPSTFIGAKVWHFATLAPGLEASRRALSKASRLSTRRCARL